MLQAQVLRVQTIPYLRATQLSKRFSTNVLRQNNSNTPGSKSTESKVDSSSFGDGEYKPSDFDKLILVWTKKFRSRDDIPRRISTATLQDSRSKARIKTCNYMMLVVFIVCMYNIYVGRTKNLVQDNRSEGIDLHNQLREDYKAAQKKTHRDA